MSSPMPIAIHGPREGTLTLSASNDKVSGHFSVSLSGSGGPKCIVLYRLRVKESSIIFSKTYGLLEMSTDGGKDAISIYADKNVAQSGRLSTIRVEYLVISSAEAETVRASGVDKTTCRPFFQRPGVRTYDISCAVQAGCMRLKYIVIASAVVASVVGAVVVLRRKGSLAPRREG